MRNSRIKNMLLAGLIATTSIVSTMGMTIMGSAETIEAVNPEMSITEEKSETVHLTCALFLYTNLNLYYKSEINSVETSLDNIKAEIVDSKGDVLHKYNLKDIVIQRLNNYAYFDIEVPEWKEGSSYTLKLTNLPVYYATSIGVLTTEDSYDRFETTKNVEGYYDAEVKLDYYAFTYSSVNTEGETVTVELKNGMDTPLMIDNKVDKDNTSHYYFNVFDKNDKVIPNVEIVMKTEKSETRVNTGDTGLGDMVGFASSEIIERWDLYYNEMLLGTVYNTSNIKTPRMYDYIGLKLDDVDVVNLLKNSNWLVATVTNPEKVDFSIIGDNGKLGVILDVINVKTKEKQQVVLKGTGTVTLLDGIEQGEYKINVVKSDDIDVELSEEVVKVQGKKGITIKLKAKKILAITNKVNEVETPFNYRFTDNSRISGKDFSSDYTKYYAVSSVSNCKVMNIDDEKEYSVMFTAKDEKRVKILNLADGKITEGDSIISNDNVFNPSTSDNILVEGMLGLLAIICLVFLVRNRPLRK